MPDIRPGQKWRDKDKRREQDGTVRTFKVVQEVLDDSGNPTVWIECRIINGHSGTEGRSSFFYFRRSRFGSGRANDSFELVEDAHA